ncbi:MAG: tetratricopeptide repeat protein [Cyclobacteriaceae bacterium]|nr:tetratricopeptide repeat protein [Cyclobacteriaceae bacterium]
MPIFSTLSLIITLIFQSPQQLKIDSLTQRLEETNGNEKVIILNDLFKMYRNNDPLKAMKYTEQALQLAYSINDYSGIAASLNNKGVLYRHSGNLDKALDNYIEALHIQEKQQFEDAIAYTYSNIGTIYSLKNEYQKALDYFLKANAQFESIGHNLRSIGTLNNIGNVYSNMNKYEDALEYYLKSDKLYNNLEDQTQAFVPFTNIGNAYFNLGKLDLALEFYNKSLVYEQRDNNLNGQANALHNFGIVFSAMGNHEQAIDFYNKALDLAQETGDKYLLKTIYESLAQMNFVMGDYFLSYSFLQLHNSVKDSLLNEESNRKIADLENAYAFEQQQKEIQHLQTESELQKLRISNDENIITGIISFSIMGIILTLVIFKEYKEIKKNKNLLEIKTGEIEVQKTIIEKKNENITESINYAQSVQNSILTFDMPSNQAHNSFILYKPKDIVSGDFYWYTNKNNYDIYVTADCTGHGVAGAFMTIIGVSILNEIIIKEGITEPKEILSILDERVINSLKHKQTNSTGTHGMDIGICLINHQTNTITFSGANRPLYYFNNGEFNEIKGSMASIGDSIIDTKVFESHNIKYSSGDSFYMTSDGYSDQFGGPKGKKFMTKRFKSLLAEIQPLEVNEQKNRLDFEIENWMENYEQTDDIVVTGIIC